MDVGWLARIWNLGVAGFPGRRGPQAQPMSSPSASRMGDLKNGYDTVMNGYPILCRHSLQSVVNGYNNGSKNWIQSNLKNGYDNQPIGSNCRHPIDYPIGYWDAYEPIELPSLTDAPMVTTSVEPLALATEDHTDALAPVWVQHLNFSGATALCPHPRWIHMNHY